MKNNNGVSEVSETLDEFRKEKTFIKALKAMNEQEWVEFLIYVKPPYTGVININGKGR